MLTQQHACLHDRCMQTHLAHARTEHFPLPSHLFVSSYYVMLVRLNATKPNQTNSWTSGGQRRNKRKLFSLLLKSHQAVSHKTAVSAEMLSRVCFKEKFHPTAPRLFFDHTPSFLAGAVDHLTTNDSSTLVFSKDKGVKMRSQVTLLDPNELHSSCI